MIDQRKIGGFLRGLRKEKGLTQEQLAEQMGVTNRSVSRWETGSNLPDLAVLVELSVFYEVELSEILNGERKGFEMKQETAMEMRRAADYTAFEKGRVARRLHWFFLAGAVCFLIFMALNWMGLADAGITERLADLSGGFAFGILLVGCLYTSPFFPAIQRAKLRLLGRETPACKE